MTRIILFILAFLVWMGLTWPADAQHALVGIFVAGFVAFMTGDMFAPLEPGSLTGFVQRPHLFKQIKRYLWFLYYVPLFIWECLKANIDVAFRVFHPDMPIKPGIVKAKTTLKSDTGLTFLANSITLTPGTLSVDIDKENGFLYIHWINVKGKDVDDATRHIVQRFETILKKIFE